MENVLPHTLFVIGNLSLSRTNLKDWTVNERYSRARHMESTRNQKNRRFTFVSYIKTLLVCITYNWSIVSRPVFIYELL